MLVVVIYGEVGDLGRYWIENILVEVVDSTLYPPSLILFFIIIIIHCAWDDQTLTLINIIILKSDI